MVHLVSLGTAGLGNDLLHVLDLSLAAGEGTELEKKKVSFWFGGHCVLLLNGWINGDARNVDLRTWRERNDQG